MVCSLIQLFIQIFMTKTEQILTEYGQKKFFTKKARYL
jgi:hypothetical protein